jgi:catechol 2,3-dioxygenase-like lactoylglutathione lyase family enzyme
MDDVVNGLLQDFEQGRMTRRQLIQGISALIVAGAGTAEAQRGGGFKTLGINHISYEVADFRRTQVFYREVMGMVPAEERPTQCTFALPDGVRFIVRNAMPGTVTPTVGHIAYNIADWDTERVKAELVRRGFNPLLDATPGSGRASFHVKDPDGTDVQIEGTLKSA